MKNAVNAFGLVIGLAIVAVIAAKPDFIEKTFGGAQGLLATAISPVTGVAAKKK